MTLLMLAQGAAGAAAAAPDGAAETYFLWGCGLFGIAVFLLLLELFVPSGGLIGLLCGVAAVASVVAFFRYDTAMGVGVAIAYIVLTPIVLVYGLKIWVSSPIGKLMILGSAEEEPEAADALERQRLERLRELEALVGVEGRTETALRPVGIVRIANQRLDALAESGVIEAGKAVIVTEVYDNQIKVRVRD